MHEFPDLDELCARAPEKLGRELTTAERELLAIARRLLLEPQQESDRRPTGSVHHKRPFLAHANVKKRSS
jgi:hypothetical protein